MGKKRTSPLYHNRLFETEQDGYEWASRVANKKEFRDCTVKYEWRKIKYQPDEPEVFSVTFEKEAQGWDD